MSETKSNEPKIPESKVAPRNRSRISAVWLIPVLAALVGAWIAINTIRNEGPTITIVFKSAEGLAANKTKILYNGVEVGEIVAIRLSEDYQTVLATAKMSPKTDEFLVSGTKFWVVRPQISGANISGLSTLISGAYIGMEIGHSKAKSRHFSALEDAPLDAGGIQGRFFILKTPDLKSLNKGTPVYFRRLQAGEVESYELDKSGTFLNVKIFIKAPYHQYVAPQTRFWHASGVDLSLSASGLKMQTESVLSLIIGGISFETPPSGVEMVPAEPNAVFELSSNREEAFRPSAVNPQRYVLIFKESLRGLSVGAPVTLSGITIGEVVDIQGQFSKDQTEFVAPVTVELDPARYGVDFLGSREQAIAVRQRAVEGFVARGLRAQLKTGNLISGARYVAFDFFPETKPVLIDWTLSPVQLPTQPGTLESIEEGVSGIVKKLNTVPLESIGKDLRTTIVGIQETLKNTDQLLKDANRMLAPGSAMEGQISSTLQQVGGAAKALRLLADYLERHPESLIHGKTGEPK